MLCRFGHRRWLRISVSKDCSDGAIRTFLNDVHTDCLLIGGHNFALFHVAKADSKEKEKGVLVLFAERGPGIQPITVEQVQEWHQPSYLWKQDLSLHKYLKYQALMFSDAIATCDIHPCEFSELNDIVSLDSGDAMTDGCVQHTDATLTCGFRASPISEALMKRIAAHLPEKGYRYCLHIWYA